MNPIIKWPGGKRKLAPEISRILGTGNHYFEPFVGGAGVLLTVLPNEATCFDINVELINFYNIVKNQPKELIALMDKQYIPSHCSEFYYAIRNLDKDKDAFALIPDVDRAARFLYLNKTCYNGLWRENSKGEFNVPIGRYKRPSYTTPEEIMAASQYFNEASVEFINADYSAVEPFVRPGDIVYFDPPYDIEEGQNGFVDYSHGGFSRVDQTNLKNLCDRLVALGATVGVSNSNTGFIWNLYANGPINYELDHELLASRSIGASGSTRRQLNELLIVGRP